MANRMISLVLLACACQGKRLLPPAALQSLAASSPVSTFQVPGRQSSMSMKQKLAPWRASATMEAVETASQEAGTDSKDATRKLTVSSALLNAAGLDESAKAGLLDDLFASTGATVTEPASKDDSAGDSVAKSEGTGEVEGVVAPKPGDAITEADVVAAQASWSNAITGISKAYLEKGDYMAAAGYCAGELYGYGHSNVLFKPTKAAEFPFRPTGEEAMSYFVGGSAVDKGYDEDAGFAINGGKGWKSVKFTNHQVDLNGNTAIAMGSYVFTCATTGDEVTVEYTFGYKKNDDGKMRIFLHHSSVPYATKPAAVTEAEVLAVQRAWAGAIIFISKVHAAKGDYIKTAAAAAGELYGYGHSNVLFKPTKAAEFPFRPTGAEAMSYFVGGGAVEKGYDEDAGFAINGGKGWKNVVFTNHQIDLSSEVAIAMGSYVFTDASTDDEVKVEYTFGYKRCADGKVRIFLHHSSVPYVAPKN